VTRFTDNPWRNELGGLKTDRVKRLKEVENENERLRNAVCDLTLEKPILRGAASGTEGRADLVAGGSRFPRKTEEKPARVQPRVLHPSAAGASEPRLVPRLRREPDPTEESRALRSFAPDPVRPREVVVGAGPPVPT